MSKIKTALFVALRAVLARAFSRMASTSDSQGTPAIKKIETKYENPKMVPVEEWQKVLSEDEFNVTQMSGTEPAYTGKYDKYFKSGLYTCLCCGADLFASEFKYGSGCGWPSFFKSIDQDKNILRLQDTAYGMERTEVRCRQCDAHLGHVFDDGPADLTETPIPAIRKLEGVVKYSDAKTIPEEEWQKVLSKEEFKVTRQSGTELKFSGKFNKHFAPGKYDCFCCGSELFVSESKYDSGCGWPAFSESIGKDKNIVRLSDTSGDKIRTEVRCRQCNAHLGHIFQDGPKETTGERYCINSVSVNFTPDDSKIK